MEIHLIRQKISPVARQFNVDPDSIMIIPVGEDKLVIAGRVEKYKHGDELFQVAKMAAGNIEVLNQIEVR